MFNVMCLRIKLIALHCHPHQIFFTLSTYLFENFYHCQVTWLMDKNNFVSPCRKFFIFCLGLGGKIWCVSLYSRSTRSHHIFSAIFLIICEFNNFILVYINLQPSEYFRYWINRLYIVNCSDSLYIIHKIKRLDYI